MSLMRIMPRVVLVCCLLAQLGVAAEARSQQPPPVSPPRTAPPAAQDEYVPVSDLPPDEQLPAVPLVFIAYGLIWLAVLVYVVTIWRRQATVQKELDALKRQLRS
jgi:CcmD family protein